MTGRALDSQIIRAAVFISCASTADYAWAVGVFYADPGWHYAYDGNEAFYNDPDGPNPDYINGTADNQPGGRGGTAALLFPGFVDPECDPNTTACAVDNANAPWIHGNSQWEGSAPGDPLGGIPGSPPPIPPAAPGGVGTYSEESTTFLRIQDAGNPQSWGWADKDAQAGPTTARQEGNNRRIQFGHPLSRDETFDDDHAVIDNGITISFRARVATVATGPLDLYYPEAGPGSGPPQTWPVEGKGYPVSGNGRGVFMVTQNGSSGPGQLGFGLLDQHTLDDEVGSTLTKTGLVMNNRATSSPGGSVNTNDATEATLNVIEIDNAELAEWQEFWITIQKLPSPMEGNTHEVSVWHNGSLTPESFQLILGLENEFGSGAHLGMGLSSDTRWGAVDIDFFAYKQGIHLPTLNELGLDGDYNDDGKVDAADYTVWRDNYGSNASLPNDDTPGSVDDDDYTVWVNNFGMMEMGGGAAAVPEPATLILAACGLLAMSLCRSARAWICCRRATEA